MNSCNFSGRLTSDVEVRHTQAGKAVLNYTIAVDCGWGDKKRTEFVNCITWDKEALAPHLTKGKAVIVTGAEMQTRKYQAKDGSEKTAVEFTVRDLEFQQGSPRGEQQDGHQQPRQQPHASAQGRGGFGPRNMEENLGPAFPSGASNMGDLPF